MRSRTTAATAFAAACLLLIASCTGTDAPTASRPSSAIGRRSNLGADPVIVAAGDIVCGNNTPLGTACKHAQTAALIGVVNPAAVLLLGDNQYEDGTFAEYNALYGPTWGLYKSITYPVPGNHEYQTANASGYYDYFNGVGVQVGQAGDRAKGYYSYDLGTWHVIALNSNCSSIGGCGVGSAQEVWLQADLALHPAACTLAYWHHPTFSSGVHGNDPSTLALWQDLYAAHADLILTGHDHNYERFAPQSPAGTLDNTSGIREFVVGTGGKEQRSLGTTQPNSQVLANSSLGILKLVLHPTSYDWQFVPVPGDPLTDAGTSNCVGLAGNQPPSALITAPAPGTSVTQGTNVSFAGSGSDPETGALSGAALVWTSNIDGTIGTGTSFSKANLSIGTHTITLTATDPLNATGTATRTLTVTAPGNLPPVANFTFTCPQLQCTFDGSSSTDDAGVVRWAWTWGNGRGESHSYPVVTNTFAAGTYNVTLLVTDGGGLTNSITKSVTVPNVTANQPPAAAISAPANNSSFVQGSSVTFTGSGTDPEQGTLGGASLVWTSNISGQFGTGSSFSFSGLAVGTHTITLTATDAQGATGTATRVVTITVPANQPPTAAISSPANNSNVVVGTSVTFTGSGTDPEQGALSGASLVWTSNISGQFGTGTSFSYSGLAVGTHTITLTATDAQGSTGTATRTITVTPTANQPPVANFTWTCVGQQFPHQCSFDSGSSTDDAGIVSYKWDWGNGRSETKVGTTTRNTWLAAGSYNVTLTVTDTGGLTNAIVKTVIVP